MWGDNTNGLSSTGLLRPTDSSSAIRRNYNYYYYIRFLAHKSNPEQYHWLYWYALTWKYYTVLLFTHISSPCIQSWFLLLSKERELFRKSTWGDASSLGFVSSSLQFAVSKTKIKQPRIAFFQCKMCNRFSGSLGLTRGGGGGRF